MTQATVRVLADFLDLPWVAQIKELQGLDWLKSNPDGKYLIRRTPDVGSLPSFLMEWPKNVVALMLKRLKSEEPSMKFRDGIILIETTRNYHDLAKAQVWIEQFEQKYLDEYPSIPFSIRKLARLMRRRAVYRLNEHQKNLKQTVSTDPPST